MGGKVRVDDRVWREVRDNAIDLGKAHVKVGVLSSRGGDAAVEGGITLVELMAIHELGAPAANIPERAPIRKTFADAPWLPPLLKKLAKAVVTLRLDERQALDILGQEGVTQVRRTITDGEGLPPPLAEATIKAKGSSRPLVDTGRLLGAISHEVVTS